MSDQTSTQWTTNIDTAPTVIMTIHAHLHIPISSNNYTAKSASMRAAPVRFSAETPITYATHPSVARSLADCRPTAVVEMARCLSVAAEDPHHGP